LTVAKFDGKQPECPFALRHRWSLQAYWPLVLLALLAVGLSGCPALMLGSMLGSLGYEGYEYEKTGKLPGMPPQATIQKPTSHASPAPDDIE